MKLSERFAELVSLPYLYYKEQEELEGMVVQIQSIEEQNTELLKALETIKNAFWSEGEIGQFRIDDLKSIAKDAIKKATE